jgi:hypothetical protein
MENDTEPIANVSWYGVEVTPLTRLVVEPLTLSNAYVAVGGEVFDVNGSAR